MKFWLYTKQFGTIFQLSPRWGNFVKFAMFVVKIFKIEEHLQAILKLMKTENILGPHHHLPCTPGNCQDWQGVVFPVRRGGGGNPLKIWNFLEAVQSPGCWEWTAWSKFVGMSARLQNQKHIMGKNKSIVESLNLSSFTIFVLTSHWTVHIYFSQIWRILRPPPSGCVVKLIYSVQLFSWGL